MIAVLKTIYRYPIKGLSAQPLVPGRAGGRKPFPHDRIFALARPGAPIERDDPKWAQEGPVRHADARRRIGAGEDLLDVEMLRLTIEAGQPQASSQHNLDDAEDRAKVEKFFWQLVPSLPAPPARPLARRPFHGQAGQRDLADQSGDGEQPRGAMGRRDRSAALSRQYLHRRRAAWEEFDWVGSEISIGGAVFVSTARTAVAARPMSTRNRAPRSRYSGLAAGRLRP